MGWTKIGWGRRSENMDVVKNAVIRLGLPLSWNCLDCVATKSVFEMVVVA